MTRRGMLTLLMTHHDYSALTNQASGIQTLHHSPADNTMGMRQSKSIRRLQGLFDGKTSMSNPNRVQQISCSSAKRLSYASGWLDY
jgi:hypothetical protein